MPESIQCPEEFALSILREIQKLSRSLAPPRPRHNFESEAARREYYRTNPDYVFIENYKGNLWYAVPKWDDRAEHVKKTLLARKIQARKDRDEEARLAEIENNPVMVVVENLNGFAQVTKIQIRHEFDKINRFSVDNLQSAIEALEEEGVEVK